MTDYFSLIAHAMAADEGTNNVPVEQQGNGTESSSQESTASNPSGTADPNEPNMGASLVSLLLPLVLMGVIFYFMLIRPQRKKDKKVKEMLSSLKPGDRVTTIGGIYGTIVGLKDDTITLAVGQKNASPTEMVVARWAIRGVEEISVENEGELLN